MRILVTGGAGFIGSNLVDALVEQNEVAVVDNLSTGKRENVSDKAKFYEVDITQEKPLGVVFDEFQPEIVFHLAAQVSVRNSTEDPVNDVNINVIGTINLLKYCQKYKAKKFIFSSTGGAIYGDNVDRPTVEGSQEEPVCPYGIDKLLAEKYIKYFAKQSNFKFFCLRYANVYGPRQDPHGEAGVVAIFALKMLKNEPVVINGSGEQTRDFVYVGDVVLANLAALKSDEQGIYNVGTAKETNINQIADIIKQLSGSNSQIEHGPAKAGEQLYSCLSYENAKAKLLWQPQVDLNEGLEQTVKFFKDAKR